MVGILRGGRPSTAAAMALDVLRRGAAAAADDVDQTAFGEFAQDFRHVLGRFVVLAKGVGQAGVGMGADVGVRHARHVVDVLAACRRPEGAVEADD
jgi:hypothetical protein